MIGNCRSAALISNTGAIEWLCLPRFDSASVFAALLDKENGGHMAIIPRKPHKIKQQYILRTNILSTRFECEDGIFEVIDFMPRYITEQGEYYAPPDLIRYFKHIKGAPSLTIDYEPRLEYAISQTKTTENSVFIKSQSTSGPYDSLYLYSSIEKNKIINKETMKLKSDQYILISYNQKLLEQSIWRSHLKLERTKVYWLNWSERTTQFKKFNSIINRSALTLKMLSYDKTGAVLAALTTSLPETIGEIRNWDYRFCWIRDASMVVKIMTSLGHYKVAENYMKFIINLLPDKDERIQIMYGINGEKKLTESELKHLSGYENSKPVRVGNDAYKQKQNDIYGILMDVLYQNFKIYSTSLSYSEELWTIVRSVVKMVERNWHLPDKGIWEIRNESKHFTFSKLLCWVAVDRAVRIAKLLKQNAMIPEWEMLRDEIHDDIHKKAWSTNKKAFTQAYGREELDASILLMESYDFIKASDPKYKSTVFAIQKELEYNGLMYRYKNKDDFGSPKSAFTICSFWMINGLYKIGEKEEALIRFNQILNFANHVGLFSEDLDFNTKRLLGNFPQAYSHLAMIETAMILAEEEVSEEEEIREAIS